MKTLLSLVANAVAFGLPTWASAQVATGAPAAQAHLASAGLQYQSAFADYKPWRDVEPADWRVLNDIVRDATPSMGGHAGHGAMSAPDTATKPAAPETAKQPDGGHHQHGGAK